jgi:NTE family protein
MRPELRQTPEAEVRRTMEEHWKTGYSDREQTLRHPEVLQRPQSADGVFIFDLKDQGREQEKLEK